MFLTRDELKALTGLQRPSAVRRWLDHERIRYVVGADAWPRVLREVITTRLGGEVLPPPVREPQMRFRNGPSADPAWNYEPQLKLRNAGDEGTAQPRDHARGQKKR